MANSRLEKIGTIYTRTRGLLQSGALNWADRPIWYDVYEAFPPKENPQYDRPAPNIQLKEIFYEEDKIRALLHKNIKSIGLVNFQSKTKTFTQRFIDTYKKLEEQYQGSSSEEKIFTETLEMLNREREARKEQSEDPEVNPTIASAFKAAEQSNLKINVKDIFKE